MQVHGAITRTGQPGLGRRIWQNGVIEDSRERVQPSSQKVVVQ